VGVFSQMAFRETGSRKKKEMKNDRMEKQRKAFIKNRMNELGL
jgi:hypothetical protein